MTVSVVSHNSGLFDCRYAIFMPLYPFHNSTTVCMQYLLVYSHYGDSVSKKGSGLTLTVKVM